MTTEDPNAPHPVGPTMQPAVGVPLESRQDWHRNLEAAIQHHSTTLAKQPAISVVESNGKVQVQANYSEYEVLTSITLVLSSGVCLYVRMSARTYIRT